MTGVNIITPYGLWFIPGVTLEWARENEKHLLAAVMDLRRGKAELDRFLFWDPRSLAAPLFA